MYEIEYKEFLDKVHGCWYGKCLGGAAGAPVEGIKDIIDVKDFTEIFNPDLPNDDLDLQLLWLDVLESKGTLINSCVLADAWIEKCWYPFSEYGYFMKNYMRGIRPPYTGIINNSFFKEGMGCPIRSEIWGIVCAGNPVLASQYAYMDATLDHADNSVYAEQFLAVIESMAFFCCDIRELLNIGLQYVPNNSKLYKCVQMIINEHEKGTEWSRVRKLIIRQYSHPDFTNVVQNMAFVVLALLYGNKDMRDTINIALKCGYDTDCTCASAAAVIGIIKGYSNLEDSFKNLIKDYYICGIDVVRRTNSIRDLAEDCVSVAFKTPNYNLNIINSPIAADRPIGFKGFILEKATDEGIEKELKKIDSIKWEIYGPYFKQLNQPINPEYPSPHEPGCMLPDIVCMVNNEVFLEESYIKNEDIEFPSFCIDAKEDIIEIDKYVTMQGQMCCYARANIKSSKKQKVWAIIGNNDGFILYVNKKEVLKRDEIRMWTPYNNFTLLDLKEGDNEFVFKLLKRTDKLEISMGLRKYDGKHWHRSKWHTDLHS